MRSIWEDPRSVTIIRFEEGMQTLTPRFLQSLQVRQMLVIIVKGDGFSEILNSNSRYDLDRRSKDLSGPSLTVGLAKSGIRASGDSHVGATKLPKPEVAM